MNVTMKPRPTSSTLQNQRLVRAIRAEVISEDNGLRIAARKSQLPPARKTETAAVAVASIVLFAMLLSIVF